jgi:hypothetical protein
VAGEKVRDGCAGDDDVVAVAGPAAAHGNDPADVGADDDLGVDAAPVVLADGGDPLFGDNLQRLDAVRQRYDPGASMYYST